MFPRGAAGIALLMLRAAVVASLWSTETHATGFPGGWLALEAMATSFLLMIGLLTPGAAIAGLTVRILGSGLAAVVVGDPAATLSTAALVLLGPGGYSVDARMFGRRVVVMSGGRPPDRSAPGKE